MEEKTIWMLGTVLIFLVILGIIFSFGSKVTALLR